MARRRVNTTKLEIIQTAAWLMDGLGVEEMRIIRTTEALRWTQNAGDAPLGLQEYYDAMLAFAESYRKEAHSMVVDIWQLMTLFPEDKDYSMQPVECGIGEYRDSIPVCRGNRGMSAVAAIIRKWKRSWGRGRIFLLWKSLEILPPYCRNVKVLFLAEQEKYQKKAA